MKSVKSARGTIHIVTIGQNTLCGLDSMAMAEHKRTPYDRMCKRCMAEAGGEAVPEFMRYKRPNWSRPFSRRQLRELYEKAQEKSQDRQAKWRKEKSDG